VELGDKPEAQITHYPDDGSNDPYIRFETKEITRILNEAVDSLPERERLVMSLYYFEEFTMKQIGAVLRSERVPRFPNPHERHMRLRDSWTA
jgi:RNA polymerase sigma factor (sigma-70 family)